MMWFSRFRLPSIHSVDSHIFPSGLTVTAALNAAHSFLPVAVCHHRLRPTPRTADAEMPFYPVGRVAFSLSVGDASSNPSPTALLIVRFVIVFD